MSLLFRVCGIALITAVCVISLRSERYSAASLTGIAGLVLIVVLAVGRISDALSPISEIMNSTGMQDYGILMVKSLGIGIVVKTASDICTDLGSQSLSGAVEFIGKIEIMILCLPFITEITELIKGLMT